MTIDRTRPLGLIAGGGHLPLLIAEELKANGRECVAACFSNAEQALTEMASTNQQFSIGDLGAILAYLTENGVSEIALAGQIDHAEIFNAGQFDSLMQEIINHEDNRAESVLRRVVDTIEREACPVASIIDILARQVITDETITKAQPAAEQARDLDFGWRIARQLAQFNVGQTIMVKSGVVLAVEAIEGTDRMIERTAEFKIAEATVVKVPMENKDPRFDVPVVGPATIRAMKEVKASNLLLAAFETILINKDQLVQEADNAGISISARILST